MDMPNRPTILKYIVIVGIALCLFYIGFNEFTIWSKKGDVLNKTLREQWHHYGDSVNKASLATIKQKDDENAILKKQNAALADSISAINTQIAALHNSSNQIIRNNNEKIKHIASLSSDSLSKFFTDRYGE